MTNTLAMPRVFLNVPILNEIQNIESLITRIQNALDRLDYLLLIVDDGSTDGTLQYLSGVIPRSEGRIALLRREKRVRGCQRGAALLAGLRWGLARKNFNVFVEMDGDLSHRPEELLAGIEVIAKGSADVAIASKYVAGSCITGRTPARTLISIICNTAVRSLIRPNILDFSNGFRFYSSEAAALIPQYRIRYGSPIYLTEVMAIWLKHDMRVVEIPGHYMGRDKGASKVRVRDYVEASLGILEIATRYRILGFERDATFDPSLHIAAAESPVAVSIDP